MKAREIVMREVQELAPRLVGVSARPGQHCAARLADAKLPDGWGIEGMTPLQQKIGSLERPPETKASRVSRWLTATGYSIVRWIVTAGYLVLGVGGNMFVSADNQSFDLLAATVAYAILMLLLWLHERFPPRL